jgi:hypothetical protein
MKPESLGKLAWILIYSGGFCLMVAFALYSVSEWGAIALAVSGVAEIICGVVLIWLRSRSP